MKKAFFETIANALEVLSDHGSAIIISLMAGIVLGAGVVAHDLTHQRPAPKSQESRQIIETVTVTGYCPGPPCVTKRGVVDGLTATMIKAHVGICAVDRTVYPVGTWFLVPGYGYCVAHDTGSAVKGKHIDVYFDTPGEARKWGRKQLQVLRLL